MHTILLLKQISPKLYYNILDSIPHKVVEDNKDSKGSKFIKYKIINDDIVLSKREAMIKKDEERGVLDEYGNNVFADLGKGNDLLPGMYLSRLEKPWSKDKGGDIQSTDGNAFVYYSFELEINIGKYLLGQSYNSVPAGSLFSMILSSIFLLVDDAVPQLESEDYRKVPCQWLYPSGSIPMEYEIPVWPELERMYAKLCPGQDFPSKAEILKVLACTDDPEIKGAMHNLFPDLFPFKSSLGEQAAMSYFNECCPPDYKLKRIDYTLDIYTEYKEILLNLVSMGYGLCKGDSKVYFDETAKKVESSYIRFSSYHINIYDKYAELASNDKLDGVEEAAEFLLRFEVQLLRDYLNREVKKNVIGYVNMKRELPYFLDDDFEKYIIQKCLKRLIGEGNYYTYDCAKEIINASGLKENMKKKLCRVLSHVAKRGGINNFLKCVKNGTITDCGKYDTAKGYLKTLHGLNVNPVTISRAVQKQMESIEQKIPMELRPALLRYPQYRYGVDFLYNPLVYLEIHHWILEESRRKGKPQMVGYFSGITMQQGLGK